MVIIKKLLFGFVLITSYLLLVTPAQAASFKINPSSGTFNQNCTSSVDVILDAEGGSTNAADIIIDYDPAQVEVTQMKAGTVYTNYFGNVVDNTNGVIRLTGASFVGTFTSSGVFATIQFKPKNNSGSSSFSIRFTGANPYNTLDSNIADANTSNDLLSSVQNGTFNFGSSSCVTDTTPPSIAFQSPTNGQQNVPSDANIQVQISDSGSGVNISTVEIVINGVSYNSSSPRATVTGNNSNYQITIDPYDPLFTSQANTVLVRATDYSSNSRQDSISFNVPSSGPTSTPTPTNAPTLAPTVTPNPSLPTSAITTTPRPTITPFTCPVVPTCALCSLATPTPSPSFYPDNNSPAIEFIKPQDKGEIDSTPQISIRLSDSGSGVDLNTVKITFDNLIFTRSDTQFSYTGDASSYTIKLQLDRSYTPESKHSITVFISDVSGNGVSKTINVTVSKTLANQVLEFFYPDPTKQKQPVNLLPFFLAALAIAAFVFYLYRPIIFTDNRHPLGFVYNSQTREPIPGVKVDVLDSSGHKVKTVTSNVFGIFAIKTVPDKYKLVPQSTSFLFPALVKNHLNYPHPYFGQLTSEYQDIPLDPQSEPPFSILPKPGVVTDSQKQPVAGLTLGLRDIRFNSLVATRVTDSQGQYRFLVPHGHYQLIDISHQDQVLATIDSRHRLGGYTTINQNLQINVQKLEI